MQNLTEIRQILESVGHVPSRALGQNFLIDGNLMAKLLELADVHAGDVVLEVGPGTGSLTEELLARGARVVAVEMDDRLAGALHFRLDARAGFTLLHRDALAGKHELAAEALHELARGFDPAGPADVHLVSNLPYNAAVPIIINALVLSWKSLGRPQERPGLVFRSLTFTVQRELAGRLIAAPGTGDYGPVSIMVSLLARATAGRVLPPEAFWPRPKVMSQMLRLEFDPERARRLTDAQRLHEVLALTFQQRRKMIAAAGRVKDSPLAERFPAALAAAGIEPSLRPEQVPPEAFLQLANVLAG